MEGKQRGLLLLVGMIVGAFAALAGAYCFYVNFIGTQEDLIGYWEIFEDFLTSLRVTFQGGTPPLPRMWYEQ